MNEAIILAGGLGKRMGYNLKWLTILREPHETIASYQVRWLRSQKIEKIYVTINKMFQPGYHYRFAPSPDIQIIWEDEPCGDEGSLKGALEYVESDDLLVINCDILTDLDLSLLPPAPALVVVHPRSPWGVLNERWSETYPSALVPYSFIEKPTLPIWVSSGIYRFPKDIQANLVSEGGLAKNIIPKLIQAGKLNIFKYDGKWQAIETLKDVEDTKNALEKSRG